MSVPVTESDEENETIGHGGRKRQLVPPRCATGQVARIVAWTSRASSRHDAEFGPAPRVAAGRQRQSRETM
jgi:hypothetical protein